jgi:hypothetical protein
MRISHLAGAVAAAAMLALTGTQAGAASTPVVYAHVSGWSSPSRHPATIYFGQGGSPILGHLTWRRWGQDAYAQGRLETIAAGCVPTYLCTYHGRWASVWLHDVKTHGGTRYFAEMSVRFYSGGKQQVQRLAMGSRGYWNGPARWPWL